MYLCNLWSTADTKWSNANWPWVNCAGSADVCTVWSETNVKWQNAAWAWSRCSGSVIPPEPPLTSSIIPYLGVDATTLVQPWLQPEEPWDAYKEMKQKRLIRLICKVKGKNFEEEKQAKEFNVSVDDIKMVIKTVSKVGLTIRE